MRNQGTQFQFFTPAQYIEAGCFQFETPAIALALHALTHGKICDGCPKYQGGQCESLRKMLRPTISESQPAGETVRQEAARLGITIAEVRRRRKNIHN